MADCPVCRSKVSENAKFCAECGSQLTSATFDRAWVVAMQERIKSARQNDSVYNMIATVGIIIAVAIPFVMRYVLHFTMDTMSWLLTAAGIVLFIGSFIGMMVDNRRVKHLIEMIEQGPEVNEETEEVEEATEEAEEEDESGDGEQEEKAEEQPDENK